MTDKVAQDAVAQDAGVPKTISTFPQDDDPEDATTTTSLSTTPQEQAVGAPRPKARRKSSSSCLLLPHGSYALFVAVLCTAAWVASVFQDGCDFAKVEGPIVQQLIKVQRASSSNPNDKNQPIPPWLEFGIGAYREPLLRLNPEDNSYAYETNLEQACYFYPLDDDEDDSTEKKATSTYSASSTLFDAAWTTARAFSFLALVLGGGGTLFVWCSTCFVFARGTWRWTGYELLLASLCQAIALGCWFTTQVCTWNECTLFVGSKADITSSALWAFGGFLVVCRYPTPHTQHQRLRHRASDNDNINDDDEYYGQGEEDYASDGDHYPEGDDDHGKDDEEDGIFVTGSDGDRHRNHRFGRQPRNESVNFKSPPATAELA